MVVESIKDLYSQNANVFGFAWNLMIDAREKSRKLELGEKLLILQAAKGVLDIPSKYRSEQMDDMLATMLSLGVCDYTQIPPGTDRVVDYFYANPSSVTNEFQRL
jgi:hypothetical protein